MCQACGIAGLVHEDSNVSLDVYAPSSTKPVATTSQIVNYLTTQWPGQVGYTRTWQNTSSLTYSIPTTAPESGSTEASGFKLMTAAQVAAAREAFELWDDLIAISLNEVTSPTANLSFAYSTKTSGGGNYARTYTSYNGTTDLALTRAVVWLNAATATHDTDTDMFRGGYGVLTYVHEVGHALGLSHPGVYDASLGAVTYDTGALFAQDTRQYTVMSYFQAGSDASGVDHVGSNGARAYGATPLLYDIAAIQAKYGADMTTRTGDTTYGFNSTAGRSAFDFTVNLNPIVAIWDAGGTDTLDVSGFAQNQRVTLVAGAYSDVGAMSQNVAIAFGATIENLIGGSGSDQLEGNAVANLIRGGAGNDTVWGGAGNDTLYGEAGDDVLTGGSGADAFVLGASTGKDRVEDFAVGVDRVRFEGAGAPASFSALTLSNQTGGVLVSWGTSGASVFLAGVSASQLGAADFGFESTQTSDPTTSGGSGGTGGSGSGGARVTGTVAGDTLAGGLGNDSLYGLDGNDALEGGLGGDLLDGGLGYDTVVYSRAGAAVTIDLVGGQNAGEAKGDQFVSVERWTLTKFDDRFVGTAAAEAVSGGGGNDTVVGGGGSDKLTGGTGADVFVFGSTSGAARVTDFEPGLDKIRIDSSGVTSFSQLVLANETAGVRVTWGLSGVSVLLSGRTAADLKASDFLFGPDSGPSTPSTPSSTASADVVLTGDALKNALVGGAGNDSLYGLDANDSLEGGRGADLLDGGVGFDVATYHRAAAAVTVNLQTGSHAGEAAGDRFVSIEGWTLGAFDDVFVGTTATQMVRGGGGNDRIFGGGGADKLYGEAGADTFVFGAAKGAASIQDFELAADRIEIANVAGVTSFTKLTLTDEATGVRVAWGVTGASVLVVGVTKAQLTASHFVFSAATSNVASVADVEQDGAAADFAAAFGTQEAAGFDIPTQAAAQDFATLGSAHATLWHADALLF